MADVEDRLRAEGTRWRAAQPPPPAMPALDARDGSRGWLVAVAAAAAVLAVVLGVRVVTGSGVAPVASPAPSVVASPVTVSPSPSEPAESPTASPTPKVTAPACRADDVDVTRTALEGAGGVNYHLVRLLNVGRSACSLTGWPEATADGVEVFLIRNVGWTAPARDVETGQEAAFVLGVRNEGGCDTAVRVSELRIALTGGERGVPIDQRVCGLGVAEYGTTPAPYVTARPVPGPSKLTSAISMGTVRPGTVARFRVTVSNTGDSPEPLGDCGRDAYNVYLYGAGAPADQTRVVECEGSITVPAGGSVTLDAEVFVPHRMSGRVTLEWTLAAAYAVEKLDLGA